MANQSPNAERRDHKAVVREEFTRQADAFSVAPAITDRDRLDRLVRAIDPAPHHRALEVATGPGNVAIALAIRCREVVGLDLTAKLIAIAERTRNERGLTNVTFKLGDAESLPFAPGEFDIVACRLAFHHFENPASVLAEMCRVCRTGGIIALEDLCAVEDSRRAALWNRIEQLRDHSHTKTLALSEMVALTARAGLEIETVYSDRILSNLEEWLEAARSNPHDADEARRLIEEDMRGAAAAARPVMHGGAIHLVHRTATLVCRKF